MANEIYIDTLRRSPETEVICYYKLPTPSHPSLDDKCQELILPMSKAQGEQVGAGPKLVMWRSLSQGSMTINARLALTQANTRLLPSV
jgi:hypothetical protein